MNKARGKQSGAALILLVFILAIAMTTYLVKTLNSESLHAERERRTMENLRAAKEAVIGWAVSNRVHPGQMPYPDRGNDGNYDGFSDCGGNASINFSLLMGQLPIYGQTSPCITPQEGLGVNAEDGYGNRFWYAVSPNIVHQYSPPNDPIINPTIISNPPYPWLRVLDRNGMLISDRVAVVILAPGEAIGNQRRSNTATVDNFLDQFQIGANIYSNQDYDQPDEDFIIGESLEQVSDNDLSLTRPYLFNDKLVYITIDELMLALEKRVAREVVASLNRYFAVNAYYPYAAIGTDQCVDGQLYGRLPLTPCATLDLASYLPPWFVQNQWQDFMFYAISSNCSQPNPGCVTGTLTVGTKLNQHALIISTGEAISTVIKTQVRPSTSLDDYLDSPENTDGDDVFDAVGTPLTSTYNDQMFIVAP